MAGMKLRVRDRLARDVSLVQTDHEHVAQLVTVTDLRNSTAILLPQTTESFAPASLLPHPAKHFMNNFPPAKLVHLRVTRGTTKFGEVAVMLAYSGPW